jgi:hypothetical protein
MRGDNHMSKIMEDLYMIFKKAEISKSALSAIEDLIDYVNEKGLNGPAPNFSIFSGKTNRNINAIPSAVMGKCHSELVVACLNRDSFNERLREMIYCAGVYCKGKNEKVMFFTSKWDSKTFDKHKKAIEILINDGVKFHFVLVSNGRMSRITI